MHQRFSHPCSLFVLTAATLAAGAFFSTTTLAGTLTVYRSVDANGTVTFSDTPSPQAEATRITVATDTGARSMTSREQLEAIRETTDRMVADRLQREQHRETLRKLRAETAAAQAVDTYPTTADTTTYYPVYRDYRYAPRPALRLRQETSMRRPTLSEQLRQRTSTSQVYRERW